MTNKHLEICNKYNIDPKKPIVLASKINQEVTILWEVPTKGFGTNTVCVTYFDEYYQKQKLEFRNMNDFMNKTEYDFKAGDILKVDIPDGKSFTLLVFGIDPSSLYYVTPSKSDSLMTLYKSYPKSITKVGNINDFLKDKQEKLIEVII